jgi:hypothetical protein
MRCEYLRSETRLAGMERWETVEAIMGAKQRLAERMPGWVTPVTYGVTLTKPGSPEVRFPVVNVPVHELPSLVLGLVTGHRSGSATYELTPSELEAAIALLTPAEAAAMYNHPNLQSWRQLAHAWSEAPTARAFAVFIGDYANPTTSPYDEALRGQINAGERSAEVYT